MLPEWSFDNYDYNTLNPKQFDNQCLINYGNYTEGSSIDIMNDSSIYVSASNAYICATGYQAFYASDFNINFTNETSALPFPDSIDIFCDGEIACTSTYFNLRSASDSIHCRGQSACYQTDVRDAVLLTCEGANACGSSTFEDINDIWCIGSRACDTSTFALYSSNVFYHNETSIYGYGNNVLAGGNFYNIDYSYLDGNYTSRNNSRQTLNIILSGNNPASGSLLLCYGPAAVCNIYCFGPGCGIDTYSCLYGATCNFYQDDYSFLGELVYPPTTSIHTDDYTTTEDDDSGGGSGEETTTTMTDSSGSGSGSTQVDTTEQGSDSDGASVHHMNVVTCLFLVLSGALNFIS